MVKTAYKRLRGSGSFRLRLTLSTLSASPIIIDDIRPDDTAPGLRRHEINLLRLIETISDDCSVEINETGTKLKYKPGIVMGGRNLEHDCGLNRAIGYFLEPLIVLSLFGKKPLSIKLTGITNDPKDPCVDTLKQAALPILNQFGINPKEFILKIDSRGVPPLGGGAVSLSLPIVHNNLQAVNWTDKGLVKRIRGVSFSNKVSPEFETRMRKAVREIFNLLLPDVYIHSDHRRGPQAGNSPGYGISVYAETTSGCCISADNVSCYAQEAEIDVMQDEEKQELLTPEEIGKQVASVILGEIDQGGVVDSTYQSFLFLLCALCPPDVSKVRVGKLSPYGIETLRLIKDFLAVTFDIKPDPSTGTVILKCMGCGLKNLSRKYS